MEEVNENIEHTKKEKRKKKNSKRKQTHSPHHPITHLLQVLESCHQLLDVLNDDALSLLVLFLLRSLLAVHNQLLHCRIHLLHVLQHDELVARIARR
jgi:hypothetical protein